MRFAFTDDQIAFRDAVRDLLAKECTPEVVRAAWPDGVDAQGARKGDGARAAGGQVAKVWSDLAEMGVLGLAVSAERGGLGLAELDWVLLAEETGYAALPHPFVETAAVVAPLLDRVDDPHDALPGLIDGSGRTSAVSLGAPLVPWGEHTDFVLSLQYRAEAAEWEACLVGAAGGGGVSSVDEGRGLVRVADVGAEPVGDPSHAAAAFDRGALGTAAQLVGLGRRMLDLTVAYAAERKQFGVSIGSQQAVKHHLANAAMKLRFAAPAVYGAAWSVTTGSPNAHRDVSTAKALASDAARFTARQALQCHGAIGYTTEYDLHLYLKRTEALARAWGDAAWHRGRVAWALGI